MSARDNSPITWWGRLPVYATTILVMAHCAFFVFVALANPLGYQGFVEALAFSTFGVLEQYRLWQLVTYAFVSPISLWFLIEMAMLFFFGQEVEKFLGRNLFLKLYALLLLAPTVFLTIAGIFGFPATLAGSSIPHFCIFIAFAIIAPNALLLFSIPAKWIAVGFFVFSSLVYLSWMNWAYLSALWLDTAVAMFFLRACGVRSLQFGVPSMPSFPKKSHPMKSVGLPARGKTRVPDRRATKNSPSAKDPIESIDPILEKISTSGLQSLTPAEKLRLEKARSALLNREDKP